MIQVDRYHRSGVPRQVSAKIDLICPDWLFLFRQKVIAKTVSRELPKSKSPDFPRSLNWIRLGDRYRLYSDIPTYRNGSFALRPRSNSGPAPSPSLFFQRLSYPKREKIQS